jgi:hypothetical protein
MTMPVLAHAIGEYLKGQTAEAGVAGGAAGGMMGGLLGGGRPF